MRAALLTVLSLPLLSLGGCPLPTGFEEGDVFLCLGADDLTLDELAQDTGYTAEIEGEVLLHGPGDEVPEDQPCAGMERVLDVADAEGTTWHVGYRLRDEAGETIPAEMDLHVGDPVSLSFLADLGYFSEGYALTVRRDGLLVGAFADHEDPDVAELPVKLDERVGQEDVEGCGMRYGYAMRFEADEDVVITPVGSAEITVDGRPLTAHALHAVRWGEDIQCTDVIGGWSWAAL